uniref:CASP-like protein n=1 Tax=Rhizophora mucronata TaxID=61149 RepID=A0A2P2KEV7_RHIMU
MRNEALDMKRQMQQRQRVWKKWCLVLWEQAPAWLSVWVRPFSPLLPFSSCVLASTSTAILPSGMIFSVFLYTCVLNFDQIFMNWTLLVVNQNTHLFLSKHMMISWSVL